MKKILNIIQKISRNKKYRLITKILYRILLIVLFFISPTWLQIVVSIIIALYLIIYTLIMIKSTLGNYRLTNYVSNYNNIIFGFKGTGKDMTTQIVIYQKYHSRYNKKIRKLKKEYYEEYLQNKELVPYVYWLSQKQNRVYGKCSFENYLRYLEKYPYMYLSNIDYGYGFMYVNLKEFALEKRISQNKIHKNDFKSLIDEKLEIIQKNEKFEGMKYYGSDSGIYLPSTQDSYLNKIYTTLPVFSALSRHLYDMTLSFNTQNLERIWKQFREQQEYYIKCVKAIPRGKFMKFVFKYLPLYKNLIFVSNITYNKYQSAYQGLLPFDKMGLASRNNAIYSTTPDTMRKQYNAENGFIQQNLLRIKKKHIKYDTRIFHLYIFGYEYSKD